MSRLDFASSILDEISLEGLDGITLPTLWQRLRDRPQFPIPVDEDSKIYFWKIIAKMKDVDMYLLPEPREFVPIFDRYDYVDPEFEIVVDPPFKVRDPHYPIVPFEIGEIRGSCAMYRSRTCITSKVRSNDGVLFMSLEQVVEEYGDSMVLVSSPKERLLALIGSETNPLIDLSLEEYCLLERIGRSRYLGEVTQGENGLLSLKAVFCKHLHYYRKKLTKKLLITKQDHSTRTKKGFTSTGSLFHLTRFYVLRKTKMACLLKSVCDILQDRPQNQEACTKIRDLLGSRRSSFKNLHTKPFQKWLRTNIITCKELYPNGTKEDWYTVTGQEKTVKVLQLVKHCDAPDTDDESENEEQSLSANVHFDYSKIALAVPLLYQMYSIIQLAGPGGITAGELDREMTLPKLEMRSIRRDLERKGYIFSIPRSRGRQTVYSYISNEYKNVDEILYSSHMEQEKDIVKTDVSSNVSAKRKFSCEKSTNECSKTKIIKLKENVDEYNILETQLEDANTNRENILTGFEDISHRIKEITCQSNLYNKSETASSKQFTCRKFKRCNFILDFLNKEHFATTSNIQRYILHKEQEENYIFVLDRRSLFRLIDSLIQNDKVKKINVDLEFKENTLGIEFICKKSFQTYDPRLSIAIEQAKFKWFNDLKSEEIDSFPEDNIDSKQSQKSPICKSTVSSLDIAKKDACKINSEHKCPQSTPKFVRVKALHAFLYYLVYENKTKPITTEEIMVYHESMSWKRFVPPLPDYGREGWFLITDTYSRMPLSLFTQLVYFREELPGLEGYLRNEQTAHYLIKFIPHNLRKGLLKRRKYISSINDAIRVLCYMGLVSIGPEVQKQKHQAFMYVHKKAIFRDTTTSSPGYVHIDKNMEYPSKSYEFKSERDLEEYWRELENICFHTSLGKYSTAIGKTLKLVDPSLKPELRNCTKNIDFDAVCDNGSVPGDGLGAAGYDSSLYLHLRRNWKESTERPVKYSIRRLKKEESNSSQTSLQGLLETPEIGKTSSRPTLKRLLEQISNLRPEKKIKLEEQNRYKVHNSEAKNRTSAKRIPENEKETKKEKFCGSGETKIRNTLVNNKNQQSSFKSCNHTKSVAEKSNSLTKKKKRGIKLVTVKPRPVNRVSVHDDKDKLAMDKLDTVRCHWSPQEDSFLLLCQVASCFLRPSTNTRTIAVHYSIVRDLLHENVPGVSSDKTSHACQRRMRYIMRHPATVNNVKVFLDEALRDASLVEEFSMPKPPRTNLEAWRGIFTKFVDMLRRKFVRPLNDRCTVISIPLTIQEFHEQYNILNHTNFFHSKNVYKQPENIEDVQKSVLMFLILSAMAVKNEEHWTNVLHELYQRYSESLLKSAVSHLRKEAVISVKSKAHRSDIRRLRQSTSPYKFSITYHYAKLAKFHQKTFEDAQILMNSLNTLDLVSNIELKGDIPIGFIASVLSLLATEQLQMNFHVPDQVLMFNSSLTKKVRNNILDRMATSNETESEDFLKYLSNDKNFLPEEKCMSQEPSNAFEEAVNTTTTQCQNLSITNIDIQINEVQLPTKASRFALYLLRHELSLQTFENDQHSQDYIALNACRVFCRLDPNASKPLPMIPPGIIEESSKSKIELETNNYAELKKELVVKMSNLLTSFIPCEHLEINDYSDKIKVIYEQYPHQTVECAKCVFTAIYKAGTKGISEAELWRKFAEPLGDLSLFDHLTIFRDAFLVMRVGVVQFIYVCSCFARDWVIPSIQIVNHGEGNGRTSESKGYSFEGCHEHTSKTDASPIQILPGAGTSSNRSFDARLEQGYSKMKLIGNQEFVHSNQTAELEQGYSKVKPIGNQEFGHSNQTAERYFLPRTWRHPDGSLNEPVIFDLLFTIQSYLISNPACTTSKICEHFSLVFPPVQLLELLEVLEVSNCIYKYYCKPIGKARLFSNPPTTFVSLDPKPDYIDHIEVFPDAVCKIVQLMELLK